MGTRMMKNIKVKTTPNGKEVIDFTHNSERFTCSHSSASVEVIRYYNNSVYFHSSSSSASKKVHIYPATEQDFEVLKKFLSTGNKFATCGKKYIFSLDNVKSYEDNGDWISVNCSNKSYSVHIKNEQDVKDFIEAMQSRLGDGEETSVND